MDAARPQLKRCLESLREGDALLVAKIDRLARPTSDLYRIISQLSEKGVSFKVVDDPTIDTTSRNRKLVMGVLALIAEFKNDTGCERQIDRIARAPNRGVKFGRKPILMLATIKQVRNMREPGKTLPEIMRQMSLLKASVYRALAEPPRVSG